MSAQPVGDGANSAPILNWIKPIELTARPDGSFEVPFAKVIRASDARDVDGDAVTFKIEDKLNGTLTIGGNAVAPDNCDFDGKATVLWTPATDSPVLASGTEVFTVRAFDGFLRSQQAVNVTVIPVPKTYLLGWGDNENGTLGNGENVSGWRSGNTTTQPGDHIKLSATKVRNLDDFYTVRHADDQVGAAVKPDGSVAMWGNDNITARFGEGKKSPYESGTYSNYPIPFTLQMTNLENNTLENFTNVMDLSLGFYHVLATRNDGTLWSWGENFDGLLGYQIPNDDVIPVTASWIPTTKKAHKIDAIADKGKDLAVVQAVADYDSSLALCSDGSLWWWGTLQLETSGWEPKPMYLTGDGLSRQDIPGRLKAFDTGPRVTQIGGEFDHFIALRDDGTVCEFGWVPWLALHTPPAGDCGRYCYFRNEPVSVNLPSPAISVRASGAYSLALTDDGNVYAWGSFLDDFDSRYWRSDVPVQLTELKNIVKIDLQGGVAMAMDRNGNIWAWGWNNSAQLGFESEDQPLVDLPRPIFGIENAKDIVASMYSEFAVASIEEGKPTSLVATPRNHSVHLDWKRYPRASFYKVFRSETSGGPYTDLNAQPAGNSFTDEGADLPGGRLVNGTKYYYVVSAVADGVETPKSREAMAVPLDPPATPAWKTINPVVGVCHGVHLYWDPSPSALAYKIYRRASSSSEKAELIAITSSLDFVDATVGTGTWKYYVSGENSAGESPLSSISADAQADASACVNAPTITSLTPAESQITVRWTKATANFGAMPADAYRVKWYYGNHSPNTGVFAWRPLSLAEITDNGDGTYSYTLGGADGTGFRDVTLYSDSLVYIKVSGLLNGVEGEDSIAAGPVVPCNACHPEVPTGVRAVPGYQQVYLDWIEDPKAASFLVQYKASSSPTWINWPLVYENRVWVTGLANGTSYDFQVIAKDFPGGTYGPSTPVVTTTPSSSLQPPSLPSFVLVAQAYNALIYLHWESLGNTPYLCFLERKLDGQPDTSYEPITGTAVGLAFIDEDVINGNYYTYRVTALDANYNMIRRTISGVHPTAASALGLIATPGNAHVKLTWSAVPGSRYQVKHSLQPGGPYDIIATVTSENTFRHTDIQNGIEHYYRVATILPSDSAIDSEEVHARPLATSAPLPPGHLRAELVPWQTTPPGSGSAVILSWPSSDGAVKYSLTSVSGGSEFGPFYTGTDKTFIYLVPTPAPSEGTHLTFRVRAVSSVEAPSDPAQTTVLYRGWDPSTAGQVALSIAGHDVQPPVLTTPDCITNTGPTNLVLRASLKASDAADGQIYFYSDSTVIGSAPAPDGEITWFNVPAGDHVVWAQGVTQPSGAYQGGGISAGKSYSSDRCTVKIRLVPDLATFQTSVTDLQLPAPGVPIVLSRAYDSRRTNGLTVLKKGWSASWDEPSIVVVTNLQTGWAEGPFGGVNKNILFISQTNSHLTTVTLPGGATLHFSARLTVPEGFNPLFNENVVSLDFIPTSPGQGTLTCYGEGDVGTGNLNVWPAAMGLDWHDRDGLTLSIDPLDFADNTKPPPFVPNMFIYTAPDETKYQFEHLSGATNEMDPWRLTKITDRNGNFLTNVYNPDHSLGSIRHGNGRKVEFTYSTDFPDSIISVKDTIGGNSPVLSYRIHDNFLKSVSRLVGFNGSTPIYETTTYKYGTDDLFPDDKDRLTETYDPRNIRVLSNVYGHSSDTPIVRDGHLVSQTDAAGRVTTFGLVNNQLTLSRSVSGSTETSYVNHDASGAIAAVQTSSADSGQKFLYDDRGRLIAQTTASGKTNTITYDSLDRPKSNSDPLGHTTTTEYNRFNQPTSSTDANGNTTSFEYDDAGNPTAADDPGGSRTETGYVDPITLTVSGNTWIQAAGLVAGQTNYAPHVPYAIVTAYEYYGAGSHTGIGTPNYTGEVYSAAELWVKNDGSWPDQNHPAPPPTTYTYDANGNRKSETRYGTVNGTSGTEITTVFNYDPQNRVIETRDPLYASSTPTLHSQRITYNRLGKQASTTDSLNRTTTHTYDIVGNLIETTYPDGSVTRTLYDEKNRAILTQDHAFPYSGDNTLAPATTNVFDADGRLVRVERRSNVILQKQTAVSGTDYTSLAGTTPETQYKMVLGSPGTRESFTRTKYDDDGRVKYSVDARGTVTESGYDDAGRRTTNRVYTAYSASTTDPNATVAPTGAYLDTRYGFDAAGNQIWVADALNRTNQFEVDEMNRVTNIIFPLVTGDPIEKHRTTKYDGLGRRIQESDEAGIATGFTYDFRGLLTSVTLDANGSAANGSKSLTTSYDYDEQGQMISQKDANQHTTTFQYDKLGRRTRRTLPDNTSSETVSYTEVSVGSGLYVLQTTMTDFRGKTITTTQDKMDRLSGKVMDPINSGETATTVSYLYSTTTPGILDRVDMSGLILRTNYFTYDLVRRLTRKDTPEGVLAYIYTSQGEVQTMKGYNRDSVAVNANPGSVVPDVDVTYTYDFLSRLKTVRDNKISGTTTYYYDDVGNLEHFVYPNGLKHTYSYTEQNRLKTLALTRNDSSLLRDYVYQLGPTGNRIGVTEHELSGGSPVQRRRVGYEYDRSYAVPATPTARVYRLTRETLFDSGSSSIGQLTHVYDDIGNRTARTAANFTFAPVEPLPNQTFNFDQRDLIDGNSDPNDANNRYDANGNTVKDESGNDTGDKYDAENHLIKRGSTISIGYDCEGNRAWKALNSAPTYYLLDDKNPSGYIQVVAEYGTSIAYGRILLRSYCYGHDIISLSTWPDPSNQQSFGGGGGGGSPPQPVVSYYGLDGQGSVRLLTGSATSATVTDTYDYDAYGVLLNSFGNTFNPYRYTAQQWDPDLGMYFLRARYYKQGIGRFWTMDSFDGSQTDPQSLHKYVYCQGNPINGIDPTGHENQISLSTAMFIGACVGATSAYYVNLAYGRAQTKLSILQGAAYGSLLGPLAGAYPTLGAAFGFAGVYVSTRSFGGILLDPGASTRQRVASAGMILASIYGAKAGLDYAKAANAGLISTGPLEPEYVVLEHGTTFSRAKAIFRDGPDENFVEPHGSKADGFSTSRVNVATPIGNAAQYAADKSSSYPNEGGPAVLRIAVPKTIVDTARKYDNEVRFEPGRGLEELKKAWTTSVYRYPPKAE